MQKTQTMLKHLLGVLSVLASSLVLAQGGNFDEVDVTVHEVSEGLYFLEGSGGNIGVSVGEDGVFLIDNQFAELSDKIRAAISTLTDLPIRFLLNTHYHGDHTGGNPKFSEAGVVIIAHDNVRSTLLNGFTNADLDAALTPEQNAALPIMTFSDSVDLYLNREIIHAFHVSPAHTDGDSFVYFKNANVIHTGDVFRTTSYPRVDGNANGRYHGIMAAYETLLEISDANTRFLPGHGVLSGRDEVSAQLDMFRIIRDRVQQAMDDGKSLEAIQNSQPTAEYDERWSAGNVNAGDDLVAVIYTELLGM